MSLKLLRSFKGSKKGSIAVIFAVTAPVVVGFSALGAEVMYWQYNHRLLQSAADAAAFSGAAQLAQGRSVTDATAAASNAAYETGLKAARADTPAISSPPVSGTFAGDAKAVEVVLSDNLPRMFTGIFYDTDTVRISARAVSRTAGARPACVLALNKSASQAVSFAGSSTLVLQGCDVASNSIASDAIDFQGATDVTTECASAVGGIDGASGSLTLTDCAAPFAGSRPFPDPYEDLVFPASDTCDQALKNNLNVSPGVSRTVSPGTVTTFCTGSPNVMIQGDITFNAGQYIFDGVDVTVNSTASLYGSGVTIFLTGGARLTMNGGADVQLTAPTSDLDPYQGVLVFADPADSNVDHVLNGNSATSFTGALYFPTSDVTFSGTSDEDVSACTLLIADEVEFTGNSFFGSNCDAIGVETAETAQVVLIVE
ncbi:pilus assembly protein TadG-related protein [Hyphococcus luteus]|uniref:Putative Flp pilus-assembly TadG-like N-terminal domain-containing protein n=1 Tax=Hyphococcus luteus TaxID=2058213 RepID=A0A2S7K3L9_9PROT|nr:pilus assembly protein TadG-related protein [Marinicaulis flavus]PQA87100.1 hypothetical protein CW354_13725 [Marinicaulis flavus]